MILFQNTANIDIATYKKCGAAMIPLLFEWYRCHRYTDTFTDTFHNHYASMPRLFDKRLLRGYC